MKKGLAAAVVVLVFAIATSVALASQAVTVKATGVNYLISGQAPPLGHTHVTSIKILSNGQQVASEMRYQAPTAANNYAFWVLTKQAELPSGSYVVELVKVANGKKAHANGKRTTLKFPFTIS